MASPASFQLREDNQNVAVLLRGSALCKENETLERISSAPDGLKKWTVMAYDPTGNKWTPWIDVAATNGTQFPMGIYMGDFIDQATIEGDDQPGPILVGDAVLAEEGLVLFGAADLGSIVNVPANLNKSGEECLRWVGIYVENVVAISQPENL